MKNVSRHTGKLELVKRLPSSINGNPRYLVRVNGWECRTPVDSSLGYSIDNLFGEIVIAEIGTHYTVPTINNVWKRKDYDAFMRGEAA